LSITLDALGRKSPVEEQNELAEYQADYAHDGVQ
jgi:hypothetical protein